MLIAKVLRDIIINEKPYSKDDILLANDGTLFFEIHNGKVEVLKSFKGEPIKDRVKGITQSEADVYINEADLSEVVSMREELDRLRKENEELKKATETRGRGRGSNKDKDKDKDEAIVEDNNIATVNETQSQLEDNTSNSQE